MTLEAVMQRYWWVALLVLFVVCLIVAIVRSDRQAKYEQKVRQSQEAAKKEAQMKKERAERQVLERQRQYAAEKAKEAAGCTYAQLMADPYRRVIYARCVTEDQRDWAEALKPGDPIVMASPIDYPEELERFVQYHPGTYGFCEYVDRAQNPPIVHIVVKAGDRA